LPTSAGPPAEALQFRAFCSELRIDSKPFDLYPEELEIVAPYFDGAEETIVILSKKNGKSTLIAALILYHLLSTPDAECIVVATSREQAEIILRQARKFIRNTPSLQQHLRVLRREILCLEDEGRARVLASDEDTADGVLPTLAIVDELHRHKTSELYAVLRLAVGTTGGRMITISTAGSSMASPLGEKRTRAYEMPGFVRDRERRFSYARSEDRSFAFVEWCLNNDDDPQDLSLVKLVNPAPWKTLELLTKERDAITPWQWLRFGCGVWTEGEDPWLEPEAWDACADPGLQLIPGEDVWLGIDLGVKHDSTGIAIVCRREDKLGVVAQIMTPPHKGKLPIGDMEQAIRDIAKEYNVVTCAYDPWRFDRSSEILDAEGLSMEEFPQSPERTSVGSETLYRLITQGELIHNGDPQLRAHVMAGRKKETERGWRLVKDPKDPRPIDALMAMMMATALAADSAGEPEFAFV
jgi:phage terminase large subunit-like protein